ncbi:hypothetical protein FRC0481_01771 [Corynebacterium diphtheriae]|nr:hypothetical protein FRC0481_01771 [Corynebacterium diphtheriae]CAB0977369.1 hypothetical protein FRC0480_01798 [Corynebacterium diphtheriae]
MLALVGALAAALCYGSATICEAVAVAAMSAMPESTTLLTRVRTGWLYGVGLAVDAAGFLLNALALRVLPLFLVESIVASSVAVTALLAVVLVVLLKQRLRRGEIIALAVLVIGLSALGATAHEGTAIALPQYLAWGILAAVLPLAAAAWFSLTANSGISLALIAGLAFGMVGVSARLVPTHGFLASPLTWSVIAYGGLAVIVYGFALDKFPTTTAASLCFTVETIIPSAIGLLLLGDAIRDGLWPVALIGFALTLGACITLSAHAEVKVSS